MTFQYQDQFGESFDMEGITHLWEQAVEMGVDMGLTVSSDMEAEQLQAVAIQLEEALEEEKQRRLAEERDIWPCHIGPYADGWCTICGGRQP